MVRRASCCIMLQRERELGDSMHNLHNLHTVSESDWDASACSGDVCAAPATKMKIGKPGMHGPPPQCVYDESAAADGQGRAAESHHYALD